ncbi:MAG TPA: GNAT family N-acetyltransferase [Treponemataceae bacterium]|nr:GNAT family N-acetyltransferase [Treponemataceae bacterium]
MVKSNIMEFDLTPEIVDEIIFAMEDQSGHFLYDSVECRCVSSRDNGPITDNDEDDDRFYAIPVWDSVSGFRMMDRFAAQLRNPIVREDLRSALSAGQGVFRNFKNILKNHTEIERLWYQFKEREFRNIVYEWYNNLRDFWGLERIGLEPEETGEIVSHDFHFREYEMEDESQLDTLLSAVEREIMAEMPPELAGAIEDLWNRLNGFVEEDENSCILIAESPKGEIIGAAISAPIPEGSFLSAQLIKILVYPEFRGLGIGKELLARTVTYWTEKKYRWLLFTTPVYPLVFDPVLLRSGFSRKGQVSVLDLSDSDYH